MIKCTPKEFKYFCTRPIHHTQEVVKAKDGLIKIRVKENYELYQWLLFYGDQIEVISPKEVRDELQNVMQRMLRKYR